MNKKLTIDEFNDIKRQLTDLINQIDAANGKDVDDLFDKYFNMQKELFSYDLSDIPFEAWQDMIIAADFENPADLSHTKANIDFSVVDYDGSANFRGCNVKNLESIRRLDPKEFDEETIRRNSHLFLSDIFSEEFKSKFYDGRVTLDDLSKLTNEQIDELKQKRYIKHIRSDVKKLVSTLDLDKIVEFYRNRREEFDAVKSIFNLFIIDDEEILLSELKNAEVSEIKNICFDFFKKALIKMHYRGSYLDRVSQLFKDENPEFFVQDLDLPEDVMQRYRDRALTIGDLLQYKDVFKDVSVDFFMDDMILLDRIILDEYGLGKFKELVYKYPEVFEYLDSNDYLFEFTNFCYKNTGNLESDFINAVKTYISNNIYDVRIPEWAQSLGFEYVDSIDFFGALLTLTDKSIIRDKKQREAVNKTGLDNLIKLEKDIGFFSHTSSYLYSDPFTMLCEYLNGDEWGDQGKVIDFENGTLSYDEFLDRFAEALDDMRRRFYLNEYENYDWIRGEFRDKHPDIFMDEDAPEELREAFYNNEITEIKPEYIPFLINRNLSKTLAIEVKMETPDGELDFLEEYSKRYGNERLLNLIMKYGILLDGIRIKSLNGEINSARAIEKALRDAIAEDIVMKTVSFSHLEKIPEMVSEYPELFVNFQGLDGISAEEKERLTKDFYGKRMSYEDIRKYPQLIEVLKTKDLRVAFGQLVSAQAGGQVVVSDEYVEEHRKNSIGNKLRDLDLVRVVGPEGFLKLCSMYGRYLNGLRFFNDTVYLLSQSDVAFDTVCKIIEAGIIHRIKNVDYDYNPDDVPAFVREKHPELFLSDDAPDELKRYFYNFGYNYPMTFKELADNPEWMPYLEGKDIIVSLMRKRSIRIPLKQYFELFGKEKGLKLGIRRSETVWHMIESRKVDLMKAWYDKTGGRFIPDFVIMDNFPIEDADKFLEAGSNWSILMRQTDYSDYPPDREAMMKLAYSFGAFDHDQRGFKKLIELLNGLPRTIGIESEYVIDQIDDEIDQYSQRRYFYGPNHLIEGNSFENMMEHIKGHRFINFIDDTSLLDLLEEIKASGINIDFSKRIFGQLYRKDENGINTLIVDQQKYPKLTKAIRKVMEGFRGAPILTPHKAHLLFGPFELKYDPDFREFLLNNIEEVLTNPEYTTLVSTIQRNFSEIKATNSNRALTWELAVSYVQASKFVSVNPGNEDLAKVSAKAGYSQGEFDKLQEIYNYGKQRAFSSIPRIEGTKGNFSYEMLRLDDPLALAIGTLTTCCQHLNGYAETCMEHSVVDKHGRVFYIKDKAGRSIAQSWVWRNKDVLCFDNIEIPNRLLDKAEREDTTRQSIVKSVYEIYKQAAKELIEEDERVFKKLLEEGKITQEQYDNLRLRKVTVGLGNNDIATTLRKNAPKDKEIVSQPLEFDPPVPLYYPLDLDDSEEQYVLETTGPQRDYEGKTITPYSDTFIEYDDSTFDDRKHMTLGKLEYITKGEYGEMSTTLRSKSDYENIVSALARNYRLNPETTRVIMNPNFAIIYDTTADTVRIGDLLFNTYVDNNNQQMDIEKSVIIQIRLAFDQIASGKKIDTSNLNDNQLEMFNKVMSLKSEMDIERGVSHGK